MNARDAYEAGFDAGLVKATQRPWVELTDSEIAQLIVDYGDDDYALVTMAAAALREKNQ